jgi:hydantoinase/carbamoylase family amidase
MRLLDILHDLREITATPGRGCTRIAYTRFEDDAHDYVWQRMRDIPGLTRVEDAAGNTFIVPQAAVGAEDREVLLVGSHLDTVIEGGWLDGALGVSAAMHVVERMAGPDGADTRVGLVIFRDEEGVRFNTGLFGSRVAAGLCTEADLDAVDQDGTRVRDVVPDPQRCLAYETPVRPAGFLECHIEQGMRLVEGARRIGVVTGIVGIRRFELVGTGVANHAGTTEMRRRVDALVPVATVIGRLPSLVEDLDPAVATCGRLRVEPGAPNIVPGVTSAIVEIRAENAQTLAVIEQRLETLVGELSPAIAGGQLAQVELRFVVSVEPTPVDSDLTDRLVGVLDENVVPYLRMASMAGHDTQHMAQRYPSSMFFIPSVGGLSHSPEESSTDEDVTLAGEIMFAWVRRCLT